MTATQLLFFFLKEECTIEEKKFFKQIILGDNGNKFFRKRPLYKPTFVEDYLSRNNRALNNFMTRLFILAPNLVDNKLRNPRWRIIKENYEKENLGKKRIVKVKDFWGNETGEIKLINKRFMPWRGTGMYVNYYRRKWNQFLKEKIESDKKFNSPFKNGERYDFKLKINNDSN